MFSVSFGGRTGLNLHDTSSGRGAFVKSLWEPSVGEKSGSIVLPLDSVIAISGVCVKDLEFGQICLKLLNAERPVVVSFERGRGAASPYLSTESLGWLLHRDNDMVSMFDRYILRSLVLIRAGGQNISGLDQEFLDRTTSERLMPIAAAYFGQSSMENKRMIEGETREVVVIIPPLSDLIAQPERFAALYLFAAKHALDSQQRVEAEPLGMLESLKQALGLPLPFVASSNALRRGHTIVNTLITPTSSSPASASTPEWLYMMKYADFCCSEIDVQSTLLHSLPGYSVHRAPLPTLTPLLPETANTLPVLDSPTLDAAMQLLSARQLAVLTLALLTERSVLLVYSNKAQRTAVKAVMSALLYPLAQAGMPWPHILQFECVSPILLDSPFPYFIGMERDTIPPALLCDDDNSKSREALLVFDVESSTFGFPLPSAIARSLGSLRNFVSMADPVLRPILFQPSIRVEQTNGMSGAARLETVLRLLRAEIEKLVQGARAAATVFDSRTSSQLVCAFVSSASTVAAAAVAPVAAAPAAVSAAAPTVVVVLDEKAALDSQVTIPLRSLYSELFRTQAWSCLLTRCEPMTE